MNSKDMVLVNMVVQSVKNRRENRVKQTTQDIMSLSSFQLLFVVWIGLVSSSPKKPVSQSEPSQLFKFNVRLNLDGRVCTF